MSWLAQPETSQAIPRAAIAGRLAGIHEAQLWAFGRPGGKRVGLLISLNAARLMDGIVRRFHCS